MKKSNCSAAACSYSSIRGWPLQSNCGSLNQRVSIVTSVILSWRSDHCLLQWYSCRKSCILCVPKGSNEDAFTIASTWSHNPWFYGLYPCRVHAMRSWADKRSLVPPLWLHNCLFLCCLYDTYQDWKQLRATTLWWYLVAWLTIWVAIGRSKMTVSVPPKTSVTREDTPTRNACAFRGSVVLKAST